MSMSQGAFCVIGAKFRKRFNITTDLSCPITLFMDHTCRNINFAELSNTDCYQWNDWLVWFVLFFFFGLWKGALFNNHQPFFSTRYLQKLRPTRQQLVIQIRQNPKMWLKHEHTKHTLYYILNVANRKKRLHIRLLDKEKKIAALINGIFEFEVYCSPLFHFDGKHSDRWQICRKLLPCA